MKRKFQLFTALIFFSVAAKSQLYNNGATFTIQEGGYVMVTGDVKNISGTITNDGKIEVQGNFINSGNYTSTGNEDSLIMTGTGVDTLTGGSSVINNLTINKSSNSDTVRLGGTTTVNTKLDYLSGVLSTDPILNPSFTLTSPVAAVYTIATGKDIVGSVKRTGWTNGTAGIFNQANMQITTNGGIAPTTFTTTMIPLNEGADPTQNEREVKRKFLFTQTGGSGFTADVRFPYAPPELNTNVEANLVPWVLISSEWNASVATVTRATVDPDHYVMLTGISASDLALEWKLADPNYTFNVTAYIKGAWNNPIGLMRTTLNAGNLLPLTQPYTGAPYNYTGAESVASIPNTNIVDWVLIEHRKPATGLPADATAATITGRKAGFLLNNGNVVDLDGVTPITFNISKQGGAFVVVRHRNHLAIMSNSIPSNTTGTFTNNYSVLANSYKKPGATSDPTVILATAGAGSTLYGMWPGDVNSNGSVTTSDITPVNIAIAGPLSGNTNVYNVRDTNLDRNVTSADVSITNSSIAAFASTSSSIKTNRTEQVLASQVPGEVK
ncbi:MAG: hypothetical protein ABI834_09895 [Ginsengibacter sp.]